MFRGGARAGIVSAIAVLILAALVLNVFGGRGTDGLVVYTSVDQQFSEPVFRAFSADTGIPVRAVFDVEAAKTTGLVNRLVAERANPQAAVFWNGEVSQMQRLAEHGVLSPYRPKDLPEGAHSPDNGLWVEFGGRARVLIVNTDRLGDAAAPASIHDLGSGPWTGADVAIAYPLFGTTATHALALSSIWGKARTLSFFSALDKKGVRFVAGNAVVRDLVVSGQVVFGLTDTDDACGAVRRGAPVRVIFPDQGDAGPGALVIPNSVGVVAAQSRNADAESFVDYLISERTQKTLATSGWFQVSGNRVLADPGCGLPERFRVMPLRLTGTTADQAEMFRDLKQALVR